MSVETYDRLLALDDRFERKGRSMPYTSLNGHMYSFLTPQGVLGVRLSPSDRAAFEAEHGESPMTQHGRAMKEYIGVPAALLDEPERVLPWLLAAHGYVATLRPKATARPR